MAEKERKHILKLKAFLSRQANLKIKNQRETEAIE